MRCPSILCVAVPCSAIRPLRCSPVQAVALHSPSAGAIPSLCWPFLPILFLTLRCVAIRRFALRRLLCFPAVPMPCMTLHCIPLHSGLSCSMRSRSLRCISFRSGPCFPIRYGSVPSFPAVPFRFRAVPSAPRRSPSFRPIHSYASPCNAVHCAAIRSRLCATVHRDSRRCYPLRSSRSYAGPCRPLPSRAFQPFHSGPILS